MLKENLKRLREEKGYSKMKLSAITGIHRKTIRFIEDGETINPGVETLNALAKGLDVSINELIQ